MARKAIKPKIGVESQPEEWTSCGACQRRLKLGESVYTLSGDRWCRSCFNVVQRQNGNPMPRFDHSETTIPDDVTEAVVNWCLDCCRYWKRSVWTEKPVDKRNKRQTHIVRTGKRSVSSLKLEWTVDGMRCQLELKCQEGPYQDWSWFNAVIQETFETCERIVKRSGNADQIQRMREMRIVFDATF